MHETQVPATLASAISLGELAQRLSLQLQPANAASLIIHQVGAPSSTDLSTLAFAADPSSLADALAGGAAAIVTSSKLAAQAGAAKPLLLSSQPRFDFARAAQLLQPAPPITGIHPQASIADSAVLGRDVSIGAFAVIDEGAQLADRVSIGAGCVVGAGCILGADTRLYPRVVLYPGVHIGARGVVHAGAVLGADGFGYVRDPGTGSYLQFPQQGTLVLEDDVEIGANTTVDRGALEETRLRRGVKLDNLVHVGHNVTVGEHVVIAAQTGISGSSSIGDGAVVAGQVGIADHVTIGPGTILGAQCGVPSGKRLRGPGVLFWGTPARPIAQYLKELAALARLTRSRTRGSASPEEA